MREKHNDAGLADAAEGPGNDGGGQIFGYARGHKRAETVCDKVHTHEPAPNAKNFPTEGMWLRRVKAMAKQATAFTKRAV